MSSIFLQCPSCGRQDFEFEKQCECGFIDNIAIIAELEKKGIDAVKNKSLILLECPTCGRQNIDLEKQCECGFNDDSIIAELEKKGSGADKRKLIKKIDEPAKNKFNKLILKEIDSWVITFSQEENCINLSTPALNAFKLKITLEDLEELLEYVYKLTNRQKTVKKLQLSREAISDLVMEVYRLTEEKRSQLSITFDEGELQEIEDCFNTRASGTR
jgi:ribosomal protein L37E